MCTHVHMQGVALKLLTVDQVHHDMMGMNESCRRLPHSVSHRKNVQSRVLSGRNRITLLKTMFTKHGKIVIDRFFKLKRMLGFTL